MGIASVLDLLACPHCRGPLEPVSEGRTVRCPRGHAFDLARQGYLNLQPGPAPRNADTAAMVAARDRFLAAGHYRPLAEQLLALVADALPEPVRTPARLLEVGAGTGYYLSTLLDGLPASRGVALDVSVAAARRAARGADRLGSVVADVWRALPLADAAVDVVLDVFAPRHPAEFRRVLRPDGILVTATPAPDHLVELREPLGLLDLQPDKHEQLRATLTAPFADGLSRTVRYPVTLDETALHDLVAMGPNAFHRTAAEIAALARSVPQPATVTVAVDLGVWTPRR